MPVRCRPDETPRAVRALFLPVRIPRPVATRSTKARRAALPRDPSWQASGAHSIEEYVAWASHVCGMACLKMILAHRTGRDRADAGARPRLHASRRLHSGCRVG